MIPCHQIVDEKLPDFAGAIDLKSDIIIRSCQNKYLLNIEQIQVQKASKNVSKKQINKLKNYRKIMLNTTRK